MTETKPHRILVADPDPCISQTLQEFLIHAGFRAETAGNRDDVLEMTADGEYGVVILDHLLNAYGDVDIVEQLKETNPEVCTIILVSYPLVEYVLVAFRKGAFDVIIKPVDLFELRDTIDRAFQQHTLNKAYREALGKGDKTIGTNQSTPVHF